MAAVGYGVDVHREKFFQRKCRTAHLDSESADHKAKRLGTVKKLQDIAVAIKERKKPEVAEAGSQVSMPAGRHLLNSNCQATPND